MENAICRDRAEKSILTLHIDCNAVIVYNELTRRAVKRKVYFWPPDQHREFYFHYNKNVVWAYTK